MRGGGVRGADRFIFPAPDASRMDVRALFFASYRELIGTSAMELRVPDGATVADLVGELRARGAPWDRLPRDPAVAVNLEYAAAETLLAPGDEVAFIPPVAGG